MKLKNNKVFIVARREYTKVVRKPSFWISTLFFPVFIVVIMLITGFSSMQFEKNLKNGTENAKEIIIVDKTNLIDRSKLEGSIFKFSDDVETGKVKVLSGQIDALIYYPEDFITSKRVEIYEEDKGLFLQSRFNDFAQNLIKDSIISQISQEQRELYTSSFNFQVKTYSNGAEVKIGIKDLIVPAASVLVYFVLTTFGVSYLLLSVSEEKENRAMEIVLSTISPKQLISGKILGLIGVVITQVILLILLSIVAVYLTGGILSSIFSSADVGASAASASNFSINLADTEFSIPQLVGQIVLGVIYTFIGFFILACTMIGVGAASPSYKEAQSLSSIFIIISIMPVYFISIILSDPSGTLAKVFSYIPFTASFILLFRNALGGLSIGEVVFSIGVLLVYCYIFVILAFKLFEFGSLEYSKRISLVDFFKTFKKHKRIEN